MTERTESPVMLWVQGILFTVLVPGVVAIWAPLAINGGQPLATGAWRLGWIPLLAGVALYLRCLASFLAAHGTPAIFFTRPLRFVLGEEPAALVQGELYRFSRNPMYLAVVVTIFGQATLFASRRIALYGVAVAIFFHLVVVLLEEPHLRAKQGETYDDYCRRVPRWLGLGR